MRLDVQGTRGLQFVAAPQRDELRNPSRSRHGALARVQRIEVFAPHERRGFFLLCKQRVPLARIELARRGEHAGDIIDFARPLAHMTLKLCIAQLNFLVGDTAGNAQKIIAASKTAYAQGARVVLTPELSICGYPAEDLLLRPSFIAASNDAVKT